MVGLVLTATCQLHNQLMRGSVVNARAVRVARYDQVIRGYLHDDVAFTLTENSGCTELARNHSAFEPIIHTINNSDPMLSESSNFLIHFDRKEPEPTDAQVCVKTRVFS